MPPSRPLLQELLASRTRQQLLECLRSLGRAPCGQARKDELVSHLHDVCCSDSDHEAVCKVLLGPLRKRELHSWLLHLRQLGLPVLPKAAWGGASKTALVDAFIRMDAILERTDNAAGPASESPMAIVPYEPEAPQKKLVAKWIAKAKKWLGKAARKRQSAEIICALKLAVQEHPEASVAQIRELVGKAVGLELQGGEQKLFFDTQLLKVTQPKPRRKRRRRRFTLMLGRGSHPAASHPAVRQPNCYDLPHLGESQPGA